MAWRGRPGEFPGGCAREKQGEERE
jgi:hypothetical protein